MPIVSYIGENLYILCKSRVLLEVKYIHNSKDVLYMHHDDSEKHVFKKNEASLIMNKLTLNLSQTINMAISVFDKWSPRLLSWI